MKKQTFKTLKKIGLIALMCCVSSCYQLRASVDTDKPVLMNRSAAFKNLRRQKFTRHGNQVFLFWGLVGNDNQAIAEHLQEELEGHSALQAVKIRRENSLGDMLISLVTLGVVAPRSFTITGEVVE